MINIKKKTIRYLQKNDINEWIFLPEDHVTISFWFAIEKNISPSIIELSIFMCLMSYYKKVPGDPLPLPVNAEPLEEALKMSPFATWFWHMKYKWKFF